MTLTNFSTEDLLKELKDRYDATAFVGESTTGFIIAVQGDAANILYMTALVGKAIVDGENDENRNDLN